MKYAHYDEATGKLIGWYDDEVHGTYIHEVLDEDGMIETPSYYDVSNIPTPNIKVNNEDWQIAIDNNYNFIDVDTNTLSFKDFRTLDELKTVKENEINTACGNEIENGFISNALGSDYNYKSEQIDQLNLIGMVTAGTDDYFKAGVADADGNIAWNYELHTIAQFTQVLQDGKAHKQALLQKANDLKVQIENATTLDELDLIGW